MTECAECKRTGSTGPKRESVPCALCGEHRCSVHSVLVSIHDLHSPVREAVAARELLKGQPVGGWYSFCGRPSHLPKGATIRYGKDREGGKMVERVLEHQKPEYLIEFSMFEVGVIENGFENLWEQSHFELSCDLTETMTVLAKMFQGDTSEDTFVRRLLLALDWGASKRPTFFKFTEEQFNNFVGEEPTFKKVASFACSRCGVVICLNRLAPFYDSKLLKKLIHDPDQLPSLRS